MDARLKAYSVDHPQLRNAEARIKRGLAPDVVGEARIRDLDGEMDVAGAKIFQFSLPVEEDEVGSRKVSAESRNVVSCATIKSSEIRLEQHLVNAIFTASW